MAYLSKAGGNRLGDLLQAALAAGEHFLRIGLNIAGLRQGHLGQARADQLIDQH